MKKFLQSYFVVLGALGLGILCGLFGQGIQLAEIVTTLFMNFLKLIAAPIVFLAIVSTVSNMHGLEEMQKLGKRVLTYTLLTTLLAAMTALLLFVSINPAQGVSFVAGGATVTQEGSYWTFFLNIIPSNFMKAFLENNVIGLAFVGFLLGIAILKLPQEHGKIAASGFTAMFKAVLKVAEFITLFIPIAIWAFTILLIQDLRANFEHFHSLMLYLSVVLLANLVQGLIVIPTLLKLKGVSPIKTARGVGRALALAFFSKSSNAALPLSLQLAEKNLGIRPKVAQFSLPLCTVINMNGCAAFILTTVLFVAQVYGHAFSAGDYIFWAFLATIAAIGNAGVPMGCFFLSSTFLIWMDVPLTVMGLILPFYTFLDMIETALNVWSDISVTAIVDKELDWAAETEKA